MDAKVEKKIIEAYLTGESSCSLAKTYGTYQNKILRILRKHGIEIRNASDAQKKALESGRSAHPTEGKTLDEETKFKQSESQAKRWRQMDKAKKDAIKAGAKERWEERPEESKRDMLAKAGQALHKASKEGSKAEKYINKMLLNHGYETIMHKKGFVVGEYEIDLYLPKLNTVIELDGPQHFLPVFGEDVLQKNIKFDATKNGVLISKGFTVIRVKYIVKHLSDKIKRDLWDKIYAIVKQIENGVIVNQLVEVELNAQ